jgi:hypothetical protein
MIDVSIGEICMPMASPPSIPQVTPQDTDAETLELCRPMCHSTDFVPQVQPQEMMPAPPLQYHLSENPSSGLGYHLHDPTLLPSAVMQHQVHSDGPPMKKARTEATAFAAAGNILMSEGMPPGCSALAIDAVLQPPPYETTGFCKPHTAAKYITPALFIFFGSPVKV